MSAPVPPPPPGLNIHESRAPELYAASITTWILAFTAVCLRFWCRKLTESGLKVDDWLIVVALLFALGFMASTLVWIHQGYGHHLWVLTPAFVPHFFKNLFTGEILYTLVLCFAKYSILAFYRRIFSTSIKLPVYILGAVVTCWGIAVIFVTIFQCTPVSDFWNRTPSSHCPVSDYAFFIGNAVPNIVTDAAILSLPLPYIFRLHRTTAQKFALAGIFMLGGFVVIISIVRLVILVDTDLKSLDLDWNFAYVGVWTATEQNMAIVCANLPSLRPILSMIVSGSPSINHYLKNNSHPSSDKSGSHHRWAAHQKKAQASFSNGSQSGIDTESQRGFAPLSEEPAGFETKIHSAKERSGVVRDIEMQQGLAKGMGVGEEVKGNGGIHVRRDMNVDWSADSGR